jgi:hypothetical protein
MFDWLFEGRLSVIIVLAALAVVAATLWWQGRQRHWLVATLGFAALLGIYVLLEKLVETDRKSDRKEIQKRIESMASAVKSKDLNRIFEFVSDDFKSPLGRNRQECMEAARGILQRGEVTEVTLSGFAFEKDPVRAEKTATVLFQVRARGPGVFGDDMPFPCEATMVFHPESGWLLQTVKITHPVRNETIAPF